MVFLTIWHIQMEMLLNTTGPNSMHVAKTPTNLNPNLKLVSRHLSNVGFCYSSSCKSTVNGTPEMEKHTNVLKYKRKEFLSRSTCWVGSENVLLQLAWESTEMHQLPCFEWLTWPQFSGLINLENTNKLWREQNKYSFTPALATAPKIHRRPQWVYLLALAVV